ncbi:hypothetical protein HH308_28215 [Gordonia sp. TBRC 11910]|uniref:Uncharacterized protein n=1 Tax=Gordonia asplenii TaxID=2725283 RepID=A0A848L265_9ACTN|nr:hypothetical protein [Gordonia asplenii]NMO05110.1 hypothetical protein [Gordonia asplenii]
METNDDAGNLADVQAAVRGAQAAITPMWLRVGSTVFLAGVYAAIYGARETTDNVVIALVLAVVLCGLIMLIQRRRGARSIARQPLTAPQNLANLGCVVLAVMVLGVSRGLVEGGTFAAYALQFVIALVLLGAGQVAFWVLTKRRVG